MLERSIFINALERETAAERSAFLDETCAHDPALRQRVEALLHSHGTAGTFLGKPVPNRLAEQLGVPPGTAETQPPQADGDDELELTFLALSDRPESLGKLGHYEVQEVIGRGGMGVVLRAFDEKLHRMVAIKVMSPLLATSAAARKRFSREARAAAAVTHDHIVTIHAVEEANNLPYLVMQYISGSSLEQRLDRTGPLALAEVLRIGMQTAMGLSAAHAQGLIHRDIKPANILLENGIERVKITDFGLARAAADASVTQTGVVAGTPQYMAPEQARGEALDARADLFSLGSVLYAMCTGRTPFRASGSMAVLKRVCEETPTPIREINPDIPQWLVGIIDKLHAKNPDGRFQSATEVADVLGRHLAQVQHPSALEQVSSLPLNRMAGWKPASQRSLWTAAAVLLFCVLAGFGLSEATGTTQLAATVIRIFTPSGTLVVETDDPGVTVTIEGDNGLVITGAGPQEVRVRPGSYQVQATKDGKLIRADQELVTISRGGRQVVRVSLEPRFAAAAREEARYGPWVAMFNEIDLAGWQTVEAAPQWLVQNKSLVSGGPPGFLFSKRSDYQDFHLRAEARISSGGNSGILVRTTLGPGIGCPGYEAQICADVAGQIKTGSLGKTQPWQPVAVTDPSPVPADAWFVLEVIARGPKILVKVNNVTTAQYSDPEYVHRSGRIALQHHDQGTRAEFRKIEIREEEPAAAIPPFDAAAAKAHQEAWAERIGVPVEIENSIGMTLRLMPPGEFTMGTSKETTRQIVESARAGAAEHELVAISEEGVPHPVRLTKPFYLGKFEVTRGEFRKFVEATAYQTDVERNKLGGWSNYGGKWVQRREHRWSTPGEWPASDDEPVCLVTWNDALAFCKWLSEAEGRQYVLPSEAQWEFACRAGTTGLTYVEHVETRGDIAWTNELIGEYDPARHRPQPVGGKQPNAFGLYDMLGNVWEPCSDWYAPGPKEDDLRIDPTGPAEGELRVIRGGAWYRSGRIFARSSGRQYTLRDASDAGIGFRVSIVGNLQPPLTPVTPTTAIPLTTGESGAFVLLAGSGAAERKFDTLAEVVNAARDGSTIEIRGNGPFECGPISIVEAALTLRAAPGFWPIIQLKGDSKPEDVLLTAINSSMLLEGLEFRGSGEQRQSIVAIDGPLRAANCRFHANVAARSTFAALHNCEFHSELAAGFTGHFRPGSSFTFENCVFQTKGAGLYFHEDHLGVHDTAIRLRRCTFASGSCLWLTLARHWDFPTNQPPRPQPIRVELSDNTLDVPVMLGFGKYRGYTGPTSRLEEADADALLRSLVTWQGERNLFAPGSTSIWVVLDPHRQSFPRSQSFDEWKNFMGSPETESQQGPIRFHGGSMRSLADAALRQLTPTDFRLREDSTGYRAGLDGQDLGADVDLVGPGPAYERWKKTPEYQVWLKDSGQLKDRSAAKPETGAFVVQGGTGVAERRFDTLAEAVQAASDGDTIEVRGNGPFSSGPINIQRTELTIRAGEGFRPVIRLNPGAVARDVPLLATSAALVLEGLELTRAATEDPVNGRFAMIKTHQAALRAANCRFSAGIYPIHSPVCIFRNCEFLAAGSVGGRPCSGARVVLENCLRHRKAFPLFIWYEDEALQDMLIEIKRCTFASAYTPLSLELRSQVSVPQDGSQASNPIRLVVSNSIFDASAVLGFNEKWASAVLRPSEAEAALLRLLLWRGERNLFTAGSTGIKWHFDGKGQPPHGPKTLEEWRKFWGDAESDSLEGRIRFQGFSRISRSDATLDQLTPEDFRLRADSAGYRAGHDGKDLGADVDLVGPGPAYERWKQTPDYQNWLKETGQVR